MTREIGENNATEVDAVVVECIKCIKAENAEHPSDQSITSIQGTDEIAKKISLPKGNIIGNSLQSKSQFALCLK